MKLKFAFANGEIAVAAGNRDYLSLAQDADPLATELTDYAFGTYDGEKLFVSSRGGITPTDDELHYWLDGTGLWEVTAAHVPVQFKFVEHGDPRLAEWAADLRAAAWEGADAIYGFFEQRVIAGLFYIPEADRIIVELAVVLPEFRASDVFMQLAAKLVAEIPDKPIQMMTVWPGMKRIVDRWNSQFTKLPDDLEVNLFGPDDARPGQGWPVRDHEVDHEVEPRQPGPYNTFLYDHRAWSSVWKTAMPMTPGQRQRFIEENDIPEDTSHIIHQFPDGWTIRVPTTSDDVWREGMLAHHCWGDMRDENFEFQGPVSYRSLRDPENMPHASFYYNGPGELYYRSDSQHRPEGYGVIHGLWGHGDQDPIPEYKERLRAWAQTLPHPVNYETEVYDPEGDESRVDTKSPDEPWTEGYGSKQRRLWPEWWPALGAAVEDTEPQGLDVGFLRDPHDKLYPPLFDGDEMREQARARLKSHMLNEIEKEYYHADQWIYFTCYGSGISYNWDEHGDLDVQMWVDVDKYNSIHTDDPQTSEQLVADVRRILMPVNFVTCRQLELTDGAGEEDVNGDMVIQWFAKPGSGSEEENLAQKPYAAYDLETGKWLVHPKPLTPLYFGEWFLLIEPKARELATQISAVIENYERDVMDAQFWARLYQRYQNPRYRERMEESRDLAEQDKKGVRKLFLQVYRGRQQAYSPEGRGNEDERDLLQKLLEVWGVFQRLRMVNTQKLPWLEELPAPEKERQSRSEGDLAAYVDRLAYEHMKGAHDREPNEDCPICLEENPGDSSYYQQFFSKRSSWLPHVGTLWHPRREAAWLRAWERHYEGQHLAHVVTAAEVNDLAQKMVESLLARPDIQELVKTAEEIRAGSRQEEVILTPFEEWLGRFARRSWDDAISAIVERLNTGSMRRLLGTIPDLPPMGEVTPEWAAKALGVANKKRKLADTPRLVRAIVEGLPRVQTAVPQAYKMFPWMVKEIKDAWTRGLTTGNVSLQHPVQVVEAYGPLFAQFQHENRLPKGFDLNQMSTDAFEIWAKEELRDPHADNSTVVYTYEDGWTIRELGAVPQDFIDEGIEMGNCLRHYEQYHWLRKLEEGYSVFFSLRTPKNHPQVSIEAVGPDGGRGWPGELNINQEYAHGNSSPNPELRARLDEWYERLQQNGVTVREDGHSWDWDEENEEAEPEHLEDNDEWVDHPNGVFHISDLDDLHEYAQDIRNNARQFRDQTEQETHEDDEGNWWFHHYNARPVEVNDDGVSGAIALEAEHSTTTEDQEQVYDDLQTLLIACRHEGYDSWDDILANLRDHLTGIAGDKDVGYRVLQNAILYAESLRTARTQGVPVDQPLPPNLFSEHRAVQSVYAEQLPSYEEYTGEIFEGLNSQQAFLPPASQGETEEPEGVGIPGHRDQLNLDEANLLTGRAREIYRYIQQRGVFERIRAGDAPDKVQAAIDQLARYGIGIAGDSERHAIEMYMNNVALRQFGAVKTGSWTDIMNKAQKIRGSGGVSLLNNGYDHAIGRVQGDHNEYTTQIWRQDPASRAISMWDCRVLNVTEPMEVDGKQVAPGDPCPWQQFVWGRTRQFKKFEGRPCAHTLALYWESLGQPLDDQGPGGAPGTPPAVPPPAVPAAPPPPAPAAGPIPTTTPVTPMPPDTTPVGPMIPGGTNPVPNLAPAAMGGPSTAPPPSAAPAAGPIPAGNPAGAAPTGPVSVQQQPGQGGTVALPGALSSWKLAAGPFKNGDIVRANRPLNGTDRDNVTWQIPRNAKGEVLDSDETTVWVAFPLHMTGQLEPHLVRVQTPIEAVSLSSGSPFIRRR